MTAVTTTQKAPMFTKATITRKSKKKIFQLARHYSDPNEGSEVSKSTAGVPAAGITKDEDSCT